jgi:hypothetical protein
LPELLSPWILMATEQQARPRLSTGTPRGASAQNL